MPNLTDKEAEVVQETPTQPVAAADSDDGAKTEPSDLEQAEKELSDLDAEFSKAERGEGAETPASDDDDGGGSGEPQKEPEKQKTEPAGTPDDQTTGLTEADLATLKAITPKLIAENPALKNVVKEDGDLRHVLAVASQVNQDYQHLRALSGRLGKSIPDFLSDVERAVLNYQQGGAPQQQPQQQQPQQQQQAQQIDEKKLEKYAEMFGVTTEEVKEFAKDMGAGGNGQMEAQLRNQIMMMQSQLNSITQRESEGTMDRQWSNFASDNKWKSVAERMGRPALQIILEREENISPGTVARINAGQNPYMRAAYLSADPETFMMARGLTPKPQGPAPAAQQQSGSQQLTTTNDSDPDGLSNKELVEKIVAAGGEGFDTSEEDGEF